MMTGLSTATPSRHHPPAELLLDHAGGASSDAEALMIAKHLELCPDCRAGVRECASIGGALLDAIEPARLPPNLLNRTLAAIDRGTDLTEAEPRKDVLDLEAGPWRTVSGVRVRRLPIGRGDERLLLVRVRQGGSIFTHRHVGEEWTLVLQGGFTDRTGHFGPGDFAVMDSEDEHKPIADAGEDCVCLILMRGQPRYSGLLGRIFQFFVRL